MSQSGSGAVRTSGTLQKLKIAERTDGGGLSLVRHLHGKTFVLKNSVWVDSEFSETKKLPVIKVQFGTDEYFNLASQEAELSEYFSLGQQVIVMFRGKVYEVTPQQK